MFSRYISKIWHKNLQPLTIASRKFNANNAILSGLSERCAELQIRDSGHTIGTGQVCLNVLVNVSKIVFTENLLSHTQNNHRIAES